MLYWQVLGGHRTVTTEHEEFRRGMRGIMDLDYSWNALLRPGAAAAYFDVDGPERVRPERVQIDTPGFNVTNAWWFAELSRLIYRQEFDEIGTSAHGPRRHGILEAANLREFRFINRGGTQCAIVESQNDGGERFGVLVFRGTSNFGDWLSNLKTLPATPTPRHNEIALPYLEFTRRCVVFLPNVIGSVSAPARKVGTSAAGASHPRPGVPQPGLRAQARHAEHSTPRHHQPIPHLRRAGERQHDLDVIVPATVVAAGNGLGILPFQVARFIVSPVRPE